MARARATNDGDPGDRSRQGGGWDFPRGWPASAKPPSSAALRGRIAEIAPGVYRCRIIEQRGLGELRLVSPQEDVIAEIVRAVRSLGDVPPDIIDGIGRDTNIVRDLKLDSIAVMDFIMELETRFNTVVPLDAIADVQTVGDLADILARNHAQV